MPKELSPDDDIPFDGKDPEGKIPQRKGSYEDKLRELEKLQYGYSEFKDFKVVVRDQPQIEKTVVSGLQKITVTIPKQEDLRLSEKVTKYFVPEVGEFTDFSEAGVQAYKYQKPIYRVEVTRI